jgi:hypothetical protein
MSNVRQLKGPRVTITKLIASFIVGLVLFVFAAVYVAGYAMAIPIAPSYYEAFRAYSARPFALGLVSLFVWGLPIAVVVCAGFCAMLLALREPRVVLASAGIAGMVFGYLILSDFQTFSSRWFVWWNVPHALAPWLGAAAAVWLTRSHSLSHEKPVA